MVKTKAFLVVGLVLLAVISLTLVFSTHVNSPSSFAIGRTTTAGGYLFNITINNTDSGAVGNISQVNITLQSGLTFITGTNFTNTLPGTLVNTSTVLSWSNTTNYLIAGTNTNNSYFWFNATATTVGAYNITVTTLNASGTAYSTNITVAVTVPSVVPVYPVASGNYSLLNISFNLTAANTLTTGTCWYTLTNGVSNASMSNTSASSWNATNTSIINGAYTIKFYCNDSANNVNNSEFKVFTLDTVVPNRANILSPIVGFKNITGTTILEANVTDALSNVTSASFNITNITSGVQVAFLAASRIAATNWSYSLDSTTIADGTYNVTLYATDFAGNTNSTNYTNIIIDNVGPIITLISPDNATSASTGNYNFSFNVTGPVAVANCTVMMDNSDYNFLSSPNMLAINSLSNTSLNTLSTHTWNVNCTDLLNVAHSSEVRLITIYNTTTTTATPTPGASGTNVFWTSSFPITTDQLNTGFTQVLSAKGKISFSINNTPHSVGVISLTSTTATINVSSTPQQAVFNIGDQKKFDVNGDGYYDLLVTLNNITGNQASVKIKSINEQVPTTVVAGNQNTTTTATTTPAESSFSWKSMVKSVWFWVLVAVIVVIIILIIFKMINRKKYYKKGY